MLVADDQALVRAGFRMILELEPDIEVVGEAADGREAVGASPRAAARRRAHGRADAGVDGLEATRRIAGRDGATPRVLVLTTFDLDEYVYDALRAGASGFLLKDVGPRAAGRRRPRRGARRRAARAGGHPAADRAVTSHGRRARRRAPPRSPTLTDRELEVLA